VAVVGTLLALLVFFSLFGVFITQYVPLWMEENESQLANSLVTSLSTLKSGVDDQYLFGDIPTYSVPFTPSSQSVPLLSQPTVASLSYLSGCPNGLYSSNGTPEKISACAFESLSYTTGTGVAGSQRYSYHQTSPSDYLRVVVPNRYYPAVTYYFEDDAIVEAQSQGRQTMLVPPPLNFTQTLGNLSVASSFLVLLGNATSFNGQGSKDITSHFYTSASVSSKSRFLNAHGAPRPFNVTLTLGVYEMCGWFSYLHNLTAPLGSAASLTWTGGKAPSSAFPSSSVCASAAGATYDITLEFMAVSYASTFLAQDALTFNAGGL
jgi:hypothetical protein